MTYKKRDEGGVMFSFDLDPATNQYQPTDVLINPPCSKIFASGIRLADANNACFMLAGLIASPRRRTELKSSDHKLV